MPIIAGQIEDDQEEALAVMDEQVSRALDAPGRLDLAITANSVDPTRINNFDR